MIRKLIEEIIEKYYRESDEYYSRYREDENGNDFEMDEEIKSALEEKGIYNMDAINTIVWQLKE